MNKIFINIPAYRDPELVLTIKDCLAQAKYPERITMGICRQYHPDDTFDNVDEYRSNKQFKIIDRLYTTANGLPAIRKLVNELITDEDFILQLDAHHRFTKNWDTTLEEMHSVLEKKGYRPILTGYQPCYDPKTDPVGRAQEPWLQQYDVFHEGGTIHMRPGLIPDWENKTEPVRARFISGHFIFARTKWTRDVPHDPNIYFSGEELNLTIRSFTHGYDLFHPHRVVLWHSPGRTERAGIMAWDDQTKRGIDINKLQEESRRRVRTLIRSEDNPDIDLTGYELGTERTLRDYEKYSGIHYKKRSVQRYTKDHKLPPNPYIASDEDWEASFLYQFEYNISFNSSCFSYNDYSFWAVIFEDVNGISLHREDLNKEQVISIYNHLTPKMINIPAKFLTDKDPSKWIVWGYRENIGWAEKIEGKI